jgi:channel protein (hemolysin III family)
MPASDLLSIPGFADPFSSLSHLIGAGVFAVLAVPLVRKGWRAGSALGLPREGGRIASLVVFAASAVLLLCMSGVFHLLPWGGTARAVLKRLDHAAIFVLIAGTATPIHAIMFRGRWRWGMLVFVWTLAVLGVTLKSIFFTSTPEGLGIAMYLGMGWVGVISMVAISRRYGARMMLPLVLGGVAYTLGAAVEWADPPPLVPGVIRTHELFHVAVLAGLALHWRFIWLIAGMSGDEIRHRIIRLPGHDR